MNNISFVCFGYSVLTVLCKQYLRYLIYRLGVIHIHTIISRYLSFCLIAAVIPACREISETRACVNCSKTPHPHAGLGVTLCDAPLLGFCQCPVCPVCLMPQQPSPLLFPRPRQPGPSQGHVTEFDSSPQARVSAAASALPWPLPPPLTHHDLQTKLCEGQQG